MSWHWHFLEKVFPKLHWCVTLGTARQPTGLFIFNSPPQYGSYFYYLKMNFCAQSKNNKNVNKLLEIILPFRNSFLCSYPKPLTLQMAIPSAHLSPLPTHSNRERSSSWYDQRTFICKTPLAWIDRRENGDEEFCTYFIYSGLGRKKKNQCLKGKLKFSQFQVWLRIRVPL